MDVISRKILKIIIFIGALLFFLYWCYQNDGTITIDGVFSSILFSSSIYLFASLFGFIVYLSRNYLIALIITVVMLVAFFKKIDQIIASSSWLTEEISAYIFAACTIVLVFFDIRKIVRTIKLNSMIARDSIISSKDIKSDPQRVLMISDLLERQLGRKPTYDEVIDALNSLEKEDVTQIKQ